jgi:serine protease Do
MADYCDIIRGHDAGDTLALEVLRFATGEILAGQLNGDKLGAVSSFSTGAGSGAAGATDGEAYGEYLAVTDDLAAIQVEIPASWGDVNGEPWEDSGTGAEFASVWAAPSLDDFASSWGTPGVQFNVTADKEKIGGHIQVLDWTRGYDFLDDCELDSRYEYDDGIYRGAYDYYVDCGDSADYMILAAVPVADGGDILILLEVQIVTEADLTAAERILASFDVVGRLP